MRYVVGHHCTVSLFHCVPHSPRTHQISIPYSKLRTDSWLGAVEQRLAAEHALRVEQLRVQQTLVVSQVQMYYAQLQAQQQQLAAAALANAQANSSTSKPLASYAPYSPTSPPAETSPYLKAGNSSHLQPCPNASSHVVPPNHPAYGLSPRSSTSPPPTGESLKRSRACSTVSSNSATSTTLSSSSAYTHQLHPIQQSQVAATEPAAKKTRRAPGKPTHDDVMAALRLKCERNQAVNGWATQQRQQVLASPAAVSSKKRPLAPREPSAEATMQPPASRPASRSPPLRHTAQVARVPEVVKSEPVEGTNEDATPAHNVGHSSSFRMLLNASEAIAAGAA
jgi:hypothetical protein